MEWQASAMATSVAQLAAPVLPASGTGPGRLSSREPTDPCGARSIAGWCSGAIAAVRGRATSPATHRVLQLGENLMEGAPQPTRITRPRPRRGGPLEGARDRVLDGACGYFYYRVTTVL
jgi:hypothetical protein